MIRLLLESKIRLSLEEEIEVAIFGHIETHSDAARIYRKTEDLRSEKVIYTSVLGWDDILNTNFYIAYGPARSLPFTEAAGLDDDDFLDVANGWPCRWLSGREVLQQALLFFADRIKVALKEKGVRHDLIDAVFSLGGEDDLVRLVARVEALQSFFKTDDGKNLLAGYKRAANILKAEEKKDAKTFTSEVLEAHLSEPAEKSLFAALAQARAAITPALEKEQFAAAMQQMAGLRVPVDAFFDDVKVNADDKAVRENRLNLLASLRATLHQVADFSKIEG